MKNKVYVRSRPGPGDRALSESKKDPGAALGERAPGLSLEGLSHQGGVEPRICEQMVPTVKSKLH